MTDSIKLTCHAKITPYLAVGPYIPHRRMHLICGMLVPISMHDDLIIKHTDKNQLNLFISLDPAIEQRDNYLFKLDLEQNLVVRAVRMLEQQLNCKFSADLYLHKRIPSCGGLGGGSANAAAVLLGLNAFYQLGVSDSVMSKIANRLGSDVPFFLTPGAKWVLDNGTKLYPLELESKLSIVLVIPPWLSRTAAAYNNLRAYRESNFIEPKKEVIPTGTVREIVALRRNDLTLFHDSNVPPLEMRAHLQKLYNSKIVTLSGSGASWVVFNPQQAVDHLQYLNYQAEICDEIIEIVG